MGISSISSCNPGVPGSHQKQHNSLHALSSDIQPNPAEGSQHSQSNQRTASSELQEHACTVQHILTTTPAYVSSSLVSFPINAILNSRMGTAAGVNTFLNPEVRSTSRDVTNLVSNIAGIYLRSKYHRRWLV
jgi:hypothetical protein